MADPFPTSWVIDVCRYCGRFATWPFCEHRDAHEGPGPWCVPVRVKGNVSPTSRLPRKPPVSGGDEA